MENHKEIVRGTILKMFTKRKYQNIDSDDDSRIFATDSQGNQVYAFTDTIQKMNVAEIRERIALMEETKISHCILVYNGTVTPAVTSVIASAPYLHMTIELFHVGDLLFDITEHVLVPSHILLSMEEAREFKKKYGDKIPQLLRSDAISRYYNFRKGEIVKVIRRDGHIAYRIVK